MLKDYDIIIPYHLGKFNKETNAFIWKAVSVGSFDYLLVEEWPLDLSNLSLANQLVWLDILTFKCVLVYIEARSSLMENIQAPQFNDEKLRVIHDKVFSNKAKMTSLDP